MCEGMHLHIESSLVDGAITCYIRSRDRVSLVPIPEKSRPTTAVVNIKIPLVENLRFSIKRQNQNAFPPYHRRTAHHHESFSALLPWSIGRFSGGDPSTTPRATTDKPNDAEWRVVDIGNFKSGPSKRFRD